MTGNELTGQIVAACYEVHNTLGAGLLERFYEQALLIELSSRGLKAQNQVPMEGSYKGHKIGTSYIADIIVEDKVIIEIKSVQKLAPVHHLQLLSYLKIANLRVGFLVNFNCKLLNDGNLNRISNWDAPSL